MSFPRSHLANDTHSLLDPSQSFSSSSSGAESNRQPIPYTIFTEHTLSITSLHFHPSSSSSSSSNSSTTSARFPSHQLTLWSSSLDGSIKHWSLASRTLLHTFAFQAGLPVGGIALDPLGRFLLAYTGVPGSNSNSNSNSNSSSSSNTSSSAIVGSNTLYRIDLFTQGKTAAQRGGRRAGGGGGGGSASASSAQFQPRVSVLGGGEVEQIEIDVDGQLEEQGLREGSGSSTDGISRLSFGDASSGGGSSNAISSLALSLNSTIALVGTSSAQVHFIDVATFRVMRSVNLLATLSSSSSASSTSAAAGSRSGGSASSKSKLPQISNIVPLLTPPDLLTTLFQGPAGSTTPTPSSQISPLQQSLDAALRATGRARVRYQPPILAAQFDRTSRRVESGAAAAAVSGPANGGNAHDAGAAAAAAAQQGSARADYSRPVRIAAAAQASNDGVVDPIAEYIAPGFFDGLLTELPPLSSGLAADATEKTSSAAANGGDADADMITFDQVEQENISKKRKNGSSSAAGDAEPPAALSSQATAQLQRENEHLKQAVQQAKAYNDTMYAKLVAAGLAPEA